jgi:hypothetical protein
VNGRIDANKIRDAIFLPKPRFNFDFFYHDEISQNWLHANHGDKTPGIRTDKNDPMKIFVRDQEEFDKKIRDQRDLFGTLFYCAVCEAEWQKKTLPWMAK